jgi:hypothetical protein
MTRKRVFEQTFREAMRSLIKARRYPSNNLLKQQLSWGTSTKLARSGLTKDQSRWRVEELEKAGFDWQASKRAKQLVPRRPPQNPRMHLTLDSKG